MGARHQADPDHPGYPDRQPAHLPNSASAKRPLGRNAIAAGVQGQRQWTDHFPNHDFSEAILSSSFDWNGIREPMVLATENDTLNAMAMLLGHLVNDSASVFADVRTYWSPDAIERVTGWTPGGQGRRTA